MRLFLDAASQVDDAFMSRALSLALRARGRTWPNPVVGCVVVHDGVIVGEGFHERAGEPHAEVLALRAAGSAASGATAYVTLEPCAHHGRTPPCADALIAAGVERVVVGMRDPNPDAQGGVSRLVAAGIRVEIRPDDAPYALSNEGWVHRLRTGKPLVTVKLGLSMDARLTLQPGTRSNMTGPSGRDVTQQLRQGCDAVLVGARTVATDDPALLRVGPDGEPRPEQPLRIVLCDSTLPPAESRVLTDGRARTLLVTAVDADPEVSVGARALAAGSSQVDTVQVGTRSGFHDVLNELARLGVGELLVEPGPTLFSSLWDAGAIDRIVTVTRGDVAGDTGPSLYGRSMDRSGFDLVSRFAPLETGIVGDVAVVCWQRQSRIAPSADTVPYRTLTGETGVA